MQVTEPLINLRLPIYPTIDSIKRKISNTQKTQKKHQNTKRISNNTNQNRRLRTKIKKLIHTRTYHDIFFFQNFNLFPSLPPNQRNISWARKFILYTSITYLRILRITRIQPVFKKNKELRNIFKCI